MAQHVFERIVWAALGAAFAALAYGLVARWMLDGIDLRWLAWSATVGAILGALGGRAIAGWLWDVICSVGW